VAADPVQGRLAFDLDSELPFPCPLARYIDETFPEGVQSAFEPRFRVMPGGEYEAGLVSDRSHMRRPDGSWLATPPPWPSPGSGSPRASVLMDWADMGRPGPGAVHNRSKLRAFAAETGRA